MAPDLRSSSSRQVTLHPAMVELHAQLDIVAQKGQAAADIALQKNRERIQVLENHIETLKTEIQTLKVESQKRQAVPTVARQRNRERIKELETQIEKLESEIQRLKDESEANEEAFAASQRAMDTMRRYLNSVKIPNP